MESFARVVCLLALAVLVLTYMNHGWPGVKAQVKSKLTGG
jgi:hypothetical protein